MYTRVVELTSKSGKARELANTINDKVLPILQKQTGFVDEAVLASDTEATRVLALSFWSSKEDAEQYHREQYPKISEMLSGYLTALPSSAPSTWIAQPHIESLREKPLSRSLFRNPEVSCPAHLLICSANASKGRVAARSFPHQSHAKLVTQPSRRVRSNPETRGPSTS